MESKIAHVWDENCFYKEAVEIFPDESGQYILPKNGTFEPLPIPNYKPKFVEGKWIETISKPKPEPEYVSETLEIKLALAEIAEAMELEKTATQLAIAELAETITGGA
ncbi:hypothetical protein [Peribacillus aracenensis]|uniref:hypothetical protein n=1 Tax=Peribacillus aracenensis TaxID=2976708 RepID=UPI0021A3720B|nr:hypothetical protein [Peribacillus sp. BBB004]